MKKGFLFLYLLATYFSSFGQPYNLPVQNDRWSIQPDGSIEWLIDDRLPHSDHIEMSGQKVSLWMQYDVNNNAESILSRTIVFPTFRLLPVQTTAHMMYDVKDEELPRIIINDRLYRSGVYNASVQANMPEKVISIRQKGLWRSLAR